jgi:hypothetical protein
LIPNTNAIYNYSSDIEEEIIDTTDELNDECLHILCHIESGEVLHENVDRNGLFFEDIPSFGIYFNAHVDLIGWQEGSRLTVKNIFETKTYDYDVHVYVKGFIGCIFPNVPGFFGILKGYAFYAEVSPLN